MTLADTLRAVGLTARITVPTVAESVTGRFSNDLTDERIAWWAQEIFRQVQATLHVRGRDRVPDGEPLVVMSNHRSYFDIPSIYCSVPGRIRMVAKKELFRVPLFGAAMRAAGFIKVDRGRRESAIKSLRESRRLLEGGTRVWIAPEGTRSKDGRLGPFKSGGFHLALEAGVRILPVAIRGTEDIMAHDSIVVHKGATVTVEVLPPIDAPSYGQERRKDLVRDVRHAIAAALGEPPER